MHYEEPSRDLDWSEAGEIKKCELVQWANEAVLFACEIFMDPDPHTLLASRLIVKGLWFTHSK